MSATDSEMVDEPSSTADETPPNPNTEGTYMPQFDISVGTTVVEDKSTNGVMEMWKVTVSGESDHPAVDEDVSCLGEHPAEAVLGAIERATDGVV